MSLLDIKDLRVEFPTRRGVFTAVEDMTLTVAPGEIVGIVGESGAGKSTIGNAIIGLLAPPGRVARGELMLDGERIDALQDDVIRKIRGRRIGMIFQDPLTSLHPLQRVGAQLVETITTHLSLDMRAARAKAVELLTRVGIPEPDVRMEQYPHQFSGGMRQRVVIALALCADPEVVIADEPTTALDVSIQAQILDLMRELCRERSVGMILITTTWAIADVIDRVVVMYRGRVVETGATQDILAIRNAYTKPISAVPRPDIRLRRFPLVEYIESAGEARDKVDIESHWLGQNRDFVAHEGALLRLDGLCMRFITRRGFTESARKYLDAVKDVSFEVQPGEVFGLVGESGSGKSTVARMVAGLHRPTSGHIHFAGTDLTGIKSERELNQYRRQMQMIFQDPYSSLNPRMRCWISSPNRYASKVMQGGKRHAR